jgi:dTMP kinase
LRPFTQGLDPDWLLQPDKGLPAPDLTILLTIPPASASARADFGIERYETVDIQTRVREQFRAVGENVKRYRGRSGRWEEVSGEGNIDEVAERIWKVVEQVQGDLSPAVHRLWT